MGVPESAGRRRVAQLAVFVTGRLASWVGVVFWLAVVAVSIPFATKLGSVETSRLTEFLPSGAASTRALQLDQRFPSGRALPAEVVFYRSSGLSAADMAGAAADRARLVARLGGAIGTPSALVPSPDGKVAVMTVPVPGAEGAIESTVAGIRSVLGQPGHGVEVKVTGEAAIQADLLGAFSGASTLLLIATGGLVIVLLAATYRSPVLWIVPVACVGIAEAVAQAIIYALGRSGLTVNGQSTALVAAVMQLDGSGLTQLQDLLESRVDATESGRTRVAAGGIAGSVLALCVIVSVIPRRRRDEESAEQPVAADGGEELRLLDARDLLESGELVRAGRAVSGRHVRRPGDQA